MKSKIKESINNILQYNGIVKFSYKKSLTDWYYEISITKDVFNNGYCNISGGQIRGDYSFEKAIDIFVEHIFNENNLAYVIDRINNKNNIILADEYDFEDPEQELIDLINEEQELIKKENNDNL